MSDSEILYLFRNEVVPDIFDICSLFLNIKARKCRGIIRGVLIIRRLIIIVPEDICVVTRGALEKPFGCGLSWVRVVGFSNKGKCCFVCHGTSFWVGLM